MLGCERKMLRYISAVTWRHRSSSLEVVWGGEGVGWCAEGEEAEMV